MEKTEKTAVFGGGCFWCTEAAFGSIKGVLSAEPGYAGGITDFPSYEEVSTGETGHAEVVRVLFDPAQINYGNLLDVFFAVHDPTTLNQQGNDVGTQYRSIILYTDDAQKETAWKHIESLNNVLDGKVVTELKPLERFFPAEEYHKKYYASNPSKPYCQLVINPKLSRLKEKYSHYLK